MAANVPEDNLKILLISPLPPPAGGMATWTKLYLESESARNNQIVLVNTAKTTIGARNLSKNNFKEEIKRAASIYSNISNSLGDNKFDIVHYNTSYSTLGMIRDLICARKAKFGAKKLVMHFHYDTDYAVNNKLRIFILKELCNLGDVILCLNRASQKKIKTISSKESIVIPNFIDMKTINHFADKKISSRIRTVIYVGHVIESKGCADIFAVAERMPHINFRLVGYIDDEFKTISCPRNLQLTGELRKEEVIGEMKASDLLLFPSHTEGFPIVILEAMACGLPIIATPVGAISDIIEDKGGILINVGDIDGICKALEGLQDIEVRKSMSEWNTNKVMTSYTVDIVMKMIYEIYRSQE